MTSNRLSYDDHAFEENVTRMTKPGEYKLFPGQNFNHNRCISNNGPRPNRTYNNCELSQPANWENLVSVDNVLSNREVYHSKSRKERLLQQKRKKLENSHSGNDNYEASDCHDFLQPEDTRMTNNKQLYKGRFWGRYGNHGYPLRNPNEFVFNGFNSTKQKNIDFDNVRMGVNTRLESRDTYKMKIPYIIEGGITKKLIENN
jgi:hypothetical protein